MNIEQMIDDNKQKGWHFFDESTMTLWGSKIESQLYANNCFVTSENEGPDDDERGYTVRKYDPESGKITNVSVMNSLISKNQAKYIARLAHNLTLFEEM